MPLLDHFHPPLERSHPWRSFHGSWANTIAQLLNANVLPEGYYAIPFLNRDGPIEIDVAAVAQTAERPLPGPGVWTPSPPTLTIPIDPPAMDEIRVDIRSGAGDPPLTAAIELVSPGNKDRPASREAFAAKCAGYLSRGVGLAVIDLVTIRRADLHDALVTALGSEGGGSAAPSAAAYRTVVRGGRAELLAWPFALALGRPLPTLPLWIGPDLAVPLDLEASYAATCADLRIRQAG